MTARQIIDEAIDPKRILRQISIVPRIRISFSRTTPESVEQGDYSETGWVDEEGVSMAPDEIDWAEGKSAVDLAVEFLRKEGVTEHSSSHFDPGGWYSTDWQHINLHTNDEEQRSYHLVNFSQEQMLEIYDKLRKLGRV